MKIVNIIGGIGNQMFQYALALTFCFDHPEDKILIDISHYNHYKLHTGFELKRVFNVNLPVAQKSDIACLSYYIPHYTLSRIVRKILPKRKTEYIERAPYHYDDALGKLAGDMYFEGYWQSPKYFDRYRRQITEAFKFPEFDNLENRETARAIGQQETVSIHVRRGDYVGTTDYSGICTVEYYRKAIEWVFATWKAPVFFIFSDDMDWCKSNIIPLLRGRQVFLVDCNRGKDSYRDMQLMSMANCCVIANSSFSWWGAWLNARPEKVVIAPSKWVNSTDAKDIYPSDWILV